MFEIELKNVLNASIETVGRSMMEKEGCISISTIADYDREAYTWGDAKG